MTDRIYLDIGGVRVPLPSDGDDEFAFMTPWWGGVLEFYPMWCILREEKHQDPWPFQAYLCLIFKVLDGKHNRTSQQWMNRLLEHWGFNWLRGWGDKYKQPALGTINGP